MIAKHVGETTGSFFEHEEGWKAAPPAHGSASSPVLGLTGESFPRAEAELRCCEAREGEVVWDK